MFGEYFARSSLLAWPIAALLIFFVTFLVVLVSVLRKGRDRDSLHHLAVMPLEDDSTSPAPAARDHASGPGALAKSGGK
jgi:hypothetical protein